jgi:hypothetical protein
VLAWSAFDEKDFDRVERFVFGGGGAGYTQHAEWDPATDNVTAIEITHTNHDMFCPGISSLPSGDVVVTGGQNALKTSIYRLADGLWVEGPDMHISRGYGSSCTLSNGKVRSPRFLMTVRWGARSCADACRCLLDQICVQIKFKLDLSASVSVCLVNDRRMKTLKERLLATCTSTLS